jgi:hypothetical protein
MVNFYLNPATTGVAGATAAQVWPTCWNFPPLQVQSILILNTTTIQVYLQ